MVEEDEVQHITSLLTLCEEAQRCKSVLFVKNSLKIYTDPTWSKTLVYSRLWSKVLALK